MSLFSLSPEEIAYQRVYWNARMKRSLIQAALFTLPALLAPLVRSSLEDLLEPYTTVIIAAAVDSPDASAATRAIVRIVLEAASELRDNGENAQRFSGRLIDKYIRLITGEDASTSRGLTAALIKFLCVAPLAADAVTYALLAALDVYTRPFVSTTIAQSPELASCISRFTTARPPALGSSSATAVVSLNNVIEFEMASSTWWFPRLSWLYSFFCFNQQPGCRAALATTSKADLHSAMAAANWPAGPASTNDAAIASQLLVHAVQQTVLWFSYATHRVVAARKDNDAWASEFKASARRLLKRLLILVVGTVVLAKLPGRLAFTAYSAALIAHLAGYAITQSGQNSI